jgi:hypothetical protein
MEDFGGPWGARLEKAEKHPVRTAIMWGCALMAVVFVIGIVGNVLGTASSVATAPGRVIQKTMQTDNIINNYEWFHDVNGRYKSRVQQVAQYRQMLKDEPPGDERARLRTETAAIQASCRDLVTQYNANSVKSNRSIFKGREAPESLDIETCNTGGHE